MVNPATITITIAIEWLTGPPEGRIEVVNGQLDGLESACGNGTFNADAFTLEAGARLVARIAGARISQAADPTRVIVHADRSFAFLLRDVSAEYPVWIPECGVVVTTAADHRNARGIVADIRRRDGKTVLQRIAAEPEESFETAAVATRALDAPTWLGLSRDMRLFEITHGRDTPGIGVIPRYHGEFVRLPESPSKDYAHWPAVPSRITILFGRGMGCVRDWTRRLEDGCLPIFHATLVDDEITYKVTAFVSQERSPLTQATLRGTHYLVADAHAGGHHMFGESQQREYEAHRAAEIDRDEELVLYWRIEAVNTGSVPRYAWFKIPSIPKAKATLDTATGCVRFESSGRTYTTATLDGQPMPKPEIAPLLKPGNRAIVEFFMPHRPLSADRAVALAEQNFDQRHAECRMFWERKLAAGARLRIPEARIDEMARAGLLHLDLIAYGLEPDRPVTATVGAYTAIGTESAPIIQFMDCMGWHSLAERAIDYFVEKQRPDGFMQNFADYMSETGPVLWTMGEHYRYTRDLDWVRRVADNIRRAADYLIAWRQRNRKTEFRGRGYGLVDGKISDPEDYYRSFILNADTLLGLQRAAEMLDAVKNPAAAGIRHEADGLKVDLLTALRENMAASPVVPLGDGTWSRTAGPWAELHGPLALQLTDAGAYTHGCFTIRDNAPLAVVYDDALPPDDPLADSLLQYHAELFRMRNVALSQPYGARHPLLHLLRNEVKPFLKVYYNMMAGLADRETYTFWEHFYYCSPHKTREEAWFLMQTRWMLYLERGDTLHLLPGIPRAWMAAGKPIAIEHAASYFGRFSMRVEPDMAHGRISARIEFETERRPAAVMLRLPHPDGKKATQVHGGVYDADRETVSIEPFEGKAEVVAEF